MFYTNIITTDTNLFADIERFYSQISNPLYSVGTTVIDESLFIQKELLPIVKENGFSNLYVTVNNNGACFLSTDKPKYNNLIYIKPIYFFDMYKNEFGISESKESIRDKFIKKLERC